MSFQDLVDPKPKKVLLLANEAIARAGLESDVKVTAFYPGSPTSEILDTMYLLSGKYDDIRMEVSINEKVALETVAGASMAGMRSLTSMKSVGLNLRNRLGRSMATGNAIGDPLGSEKFVQLLGINSRRFHGLLHQFVGIEAKQIQVRWPGGNLTTGEIPAGAKEISVDTGGQVKRLR